jgi:aryl-alcohol dehydrogenase-like predicted oxidoreductase
MLKRELGKTGLWATFVSYGAMELRNTHFRDGRVFTAADAEVILNRVLDCGINFIDTSPDYPHSEEYIGKFLSRRREEFHLATKCGCTDEPGQNGYHVHLWTRQNLLSNIDASLARLKVDHVDLWQLHNPPLKAVLDGRLIEVMQEVRRAGKVRFIGVSLKIPDADGFVETGAFDTVQVPWAALEPTHEIYLKQAAVAGIGTIIRGALSKGSALNARQVDKDKWIRWEKAKLDELLAPGQSRPQFLLAYAMTYPEVDTALVGTINPDHLEENLRGLRPLTAEVVAETQRRLSQIGSQPNTQPPSR